MKKSEKEKDRGRKRESGRKRRRETRRLKERQTQKETTSPPSGASGGLSRAELSRVVARLRVGWLGPDQGLRREGEKESERRERTDCLGGPDGRNETQIAIIYFRRPVITEPESLRATQFLLGSKPHTAEVNIRNVKKGLTDVKEVRKRKGFHFVVAFFD